MYLTYDYKTSQISCTHHCTCVLEEPLLSNVRHENMADDCDFTSPFSRYFFPASVCRWKQLRYKFPRYMIRTHAGSYLIKGQWEHPLLSQGLCKGNAYLCTNSKSFRLWEMLLLTQTLVFPWPIKVLDPNTPTHYLHTSQLEQ